MVPMNDMALVTALEALAKAKAQELLASEARLLLEAADRIKNLSESLDYKRDELNEDGSDPRPSMLDKPAND